VPRPLDELRFGATRTLNLRESLPTAREAVERSERWLREQQLRGIVDVLIITGRGNHSVGGVPVLKHAVDKLLFSLRRRGVVTTHAEHNPGAFVVTLAPLRALSEAAARRREPRRRPAAFSFEGLTSVTLALLRDLAERSLDSLGVDADDDRIHDEMHRHLRVLAPGLGGADVEKDLEAGLRRAIAEYD
jgi:hypothetical protein